MTLKISFEDVVNKIWIIDGVAKEGKCSACNNRFNSPTVVLRELFSERIITVTQRCFGRVIELFANNANVDSTKILKEKCHKVQERIRILIRDASCVLDQDMVILAHLNRIISDDDLCYYNECCVSLNREFVIYDSGINEIREKIISAWSTESFRSSKKDDLQADDVNNNDKFIDETNKTEMMYKCLVFSSSSNLKIINSNLVNNEIPKNVEYTWVSENFKNSRKADRNVELENWKSKFKLQRGFVENPQKIIKQHESHKSVGSTNESEVCSVYQNSDIQRFHIPFRSSLADKAIYFNDGVSQFAPVQLSSGLQNN